MSITLSTLLNVPSLHFPDKPYSNVLIFVSFYTQKYHMDSLKSGIRLSSLNDRGKYQDFR